MAEVKEEIKEYQHIKVELNEEGNYAIISINRPEKLNALQILTLKEITEALESFELNNAVRCVVLRGTKDYTKKPAFSAGADLSSSFGPGVKPNIPFHMAHAMYLRHKYYDMIEDFNKPLIAAVDGFALGGGCELTLVCDIVIASKRSQFGFPEIERGIFPANGGTQRMVRSIGLSRTLKMLYFGDKYSAEEMYDMGFVAYVVDDDKFEDLVHEKAAWLGKAATTALIMIKKCTKFGTQVPLDIGLQFEQLGFGINSASKDITIGIKAFLKKQKPEFRGF
ncbi:MAG: enoyl-CoA hydratase/isomerase family protein [Candidatus Lokiarchaeota archaeon]|nr:enoyl-CoA hydratase/isomerase family protein [Candidatus Lokiarchaeota archaeon]